MRRRELVKGALGGIALGGLAGCGAGSSGAPGAPAVHTSRKVRWRLASSFPVSLDTIFGCAELLAARVKAMTDGAFTIHVHQAGEIVPGLQVMDAVHNGTVEIGHTASYYYTGKNPALAFDTCVPFGMTARQQNAWLDELGGRELINKLFADFGIITFSAGNTGAQMGGWFRSQVQGLGDLKGLRIRIPGMGGEVLHALGAAVQQLPGGEIYTALERGAIDATEWVGPYDDEKLGFHRICKNYYYPGWWEPGPSLSYHVSRPAWDALPVAYQEVLRAATRESAAIMQSRYDAKNPPALERLLAAGVQLQPFSAELMRGAQTVSRQLLDDHAAKDATYKEILVAWDEARRISFKWFATAELAYENFAFAGGT